jgi:hypothetical protein
MSGIKFVFLCLLKCLSWRIKLIYHQVLHTSAKMFIIVKSDVFLRNLTSFKLWICNQIFANS